MHLIAARLVHTLSGTDTMDLGIRDKVAIVLGASKGIGQACGRALAAEGCSLALAARNAGPLGEESSAIAKTHSVQVVHRACDVTRDADRIEFIDEVVRRFSRVDILVNNCEGPKPGSFREVHDPKDWQDAIERSLLQVVKWTQAVVPLMKGWGRIVNIVSTSARQSIDGLLLSNSVRPGVIGFSKSVARELAAEGITINSILPGRIRTDRWTAVVKAIAEKARIPFEKALQEKLRDIPAGRLGEPEEVGALAAFLCSERAAYITGATVAIDGGMTQAIV